MTYSFHRGSLALDFAGTLGSRDSDAPEERIPDAESLAAWLREAGLVDDAAPSEEELVQARKLREAIYRLGRQILAGLPLEPRSLATVNDAAAGMRLGTPRMDRARTVHWSSERPTALALARIALDAIEHFATDADRLTTCELPGCGALLLSRSRSDRRRWCSMELCGNRAKVAAYRNRKAKERA